MLPQLTRYSRVIVTSL